MDRRSMLSLLPLLPGAALLFLGKSHDVYLFLIVVFARNWAAIRQIITETLNITIVIDLAKISFGLFTLFQTCRYTQGLKRNASASDPFFSKPMLFPGKTAHTRLFPSKHSFSYTYLMVGIPVGWRGIRGGLVSCDVPDSDSHWFWRLFSIRPPGAWFRVSGDDYLGRGHAEGGLREKLDIYLRTQVPLIQLQSNRKSH